ncbi:2-oxo-4-hydroxy-4-carboxy-5-ureidoimidazoline decarboxylase [Subtercola lobariae]|uniref:2-oxo-4-hydroxy-4-carboxy-5-ureidoimidazoline decarboxylase n=1 Tax=Subtercola lobariae TaxID=1588641 RepID=A0A917B1V3_9MICO|nr:2-oxo-4-hydroxy-4-carboxy-5-ureidoimidazoline decarboxylase [Subtercola lobariae]GGF17063.1 OHCU decarboxylase [Subtercola lobariae]
MVNPPPDELRAALYSCAAVSRWVDEVAAAAPFDSSHDLLEAAREATPFSAAEIDEALGDHPRIGEKHASNTAAAVFSRNEQAASETEDETLARALADGNADYEQRFGRIFLIRAKGRTRPEIVAELRRRLTLDDATELATVSGELRDIALLRLESIYAEQLS